jgi:hypothetical protein
MPRQDCRQVTPISYEYSVMKCVLPVVQRDSAQLSNPKLTGNRREEGNMMRMNDSWATQRPLYNALPSLCDAVQESML